MRRLASLIAKREGKKVEASIGNVREILSLITDVIAEEMIAEKGWSGSLSAIVAAAEKKKEKLSLKKAKPAK